MIIRKGCSDFQKDRNKNRLVLVTVVLFSLKYDAPSMKTARNVDGKRE